MIFRPEHAEDISGVYFLIKYWSLFLTCLQKKYQKGYDPGLHINFIILFVCVIFLLAIDKKVALCCFSIDKK